ncbi:MAG: hypothetical protein WEE51_00215 [Pirellulaceae bacterium]
MGIGCRPCLLRLKDAGPAQSRQWRQLSRNSRFDDDSSVAMMAAEQSQSM